LALFHGTLFLVLSALCSFNNFSDFQFFGPNITEEACFVEMRIKIGIVQILFLHFVRSVPVGGKNIAASVKLGQCSHIYIYCGNMFENARRSADIHTFYVFDAI
jgi:hypothetical protein